MANDPRPLITGSGRCLRSITGAKRDAFPREVRSARVSSIKPAESGDSWAYDGSEKDLPDRRSNAADNAGIRKKRDTLAARARASFTTCTLGEEQLASSTGRGVIPEKTSNPPKARNHFSEIGVRNRLHRITSQLFPPPPFASRHPSSVSLTPAAPSLPSPASSQPPFNRKHAEQREERAFCRAFYTGSGCP